jgi:ribosomal protein S18 acetylase RimI-like enzyme
MPVSLIAMNEETFSNYLAVAIPAYAQDNVDAGRWGQADALERSEKAHDALLPDGIETRDNYLFNIIDNESSNVGQIWVKIEDNIRTKSAFIYDIEICESSRRKGYAKSALGCIEEIVADLGATNLGLHVFAGNSAAIALYNSIGYQTVGHNMQKPIGASGS